ncbi:hypothetical protein SAMN05216282_1363 [Cryobacterium psychrotolerans]|uniref:Uncharacterized protein n=1 Tax=Cryobacterium psychrotolerans TaxID=386301 RepID=A0A1G9HQZ2_9MICO|nr:hypothetical protein [Cryobacterium psychrotolerans]TFD83946.1 hypothetical protein E3T56_11660 [Cryobacterium psychrotolerans]SDL15378.1 hypothetical protein SAMN05216282_1363 [Cryobacterium psychrotolerans]
MMAHHRRVVAPAYVGSSPTVEFAVARHAHGGRACRLLAPALLGFELRVPRSSAAERSDFGGTTSSVVFEAI